MRDAWEVQLSAVVAGSRRLQAPRKQREQFGPDSPSPICRGPTLGTGEGVNIYIRTKKKRSRIGVPRCKAAESFSNTQRFPKKRDFVLFAFCKTAGLPVPSLPLIYSYSYFWFLPSVFAEFRIPPSSQRAGIFKYN